MREMILADSKEHRQAALAKILPYQREDFAGMFRELKGYPATIRFLDPPLHEFLPQEGSAQNDLAKKMGVPVEKIKQRVKELHETFPAPVRPRLVPRTNSCPARKDRSCKSSLFRQRSSAVGGCRFAPAYP